MRHFIVPRVKYFKTNKSEGKEKTVNIVWARERPSKWGVRPAAGCWVPRRQVHTSHPHHHRLAHANENGWLRRKFPR